MKKRIGVLVSGGGTNLQALIDAQNSGIIKSGEIVTVVSNKPQVYALERAKNAGIDAKVITKKECGTPEAFDKALCDYMLSKKVPVKRMKGCYFSSYCCRGLFSTLKLHNIA